MVKKRRQLGRGVAIVGAGMSKFGMFKDKDSKDLFAEAFKGMIASVDKGMDPNEIDALYLGNFSNDFFMHQAHWGPIISDLIGLTPKPATRTEGACASSALAFREGIFAIASGFYDMVLVGGVEEMSKRTTEEVAEGLALATVPYEGRVGFTFPGVFGAVATAYFAKYGANREHLMNVTIKSHNNAPLNPKAQFPLTIRDMMDARRASAQKRGLPVPEWLDEKDFLKDPKANPAVAWPMHLLTVVPSVTGPAACCWSAKRLPKTSPMIPFMWPASGRAAAAGFMPVRI
jgi:acetyl-CoA C-acetyltransferase